MVMVGLGILEERAKGLPEFVSLSVDVLVSVPLSMCLEGGLIPLGARKPDVLVVGVLGL